MPKKTQVIIENQKKKFRLRNNDFVENLPHSMEEVKYLGEDGFQLRCPVTQGANIDA